MFNKLLAIKMDQLIKENIRLKKKLFSDSINEKTKEFYEQLELEKQQQPIIDTLKKEGEENRKALEELKPKASNILSISPGAIGAKYLAKSRVDNLNPFLRLVNDQVYLRNTPIKFLGDNIVIQDKIIPMNENLYKLISRDKNINYVNLSEEDKNIYFDLATSLNFFDGSRGSGGPSSNDYKIYKRIKEEKIQPIDFTQELEELNQIERVVPIIQEYEGEGIIKDSNYLLKRLKLLLASNNAGNTGVINEISDILKYLYETKKLSKDKFISFIHQLKI